MAVVGVGVVQQILMKEITDVVVVVVVVVVVAALVATQQRLAV